MKAKLISELKGKLLKIKGKNRKEKREKREKLLKKY